MAGFAAARATGMPSSAGDAVSADGASPSTPASSLSSRAAEAAASRAVVEVLPLGIAVLASPMCCHPTMSWPLRSVTSSLLSRGRLLRFGRISAASHARLAVCRHVSCGDCSEDEAASASERGRRKLDPAAEAPPPPPPPRPPLARVMVLVPPPLPLPSLVLAVRILPDITYEERIRRASDRGLIQPAMPTVAMCDCEAPPSLTSTPTPPPPLLFPTMAKPRKRLNVSHHSCGCPVT